MLHRSFYNIAVFASGAGSNAEKLIQHFGTPLNPKNESNIVVKTIVCNKPDAGVLKIAATHNINTLLIEKKSFTQSSDTYVKILKDQDIKFIVLAGFLWKIPDQFIEAFPNKIVNIHPALLPKYGGKGMYGHHVHEAVIAAKEKESGITIHMVDEQYDHGKNLFQTTCPVLPDDTPDTLATRIHALEHEYYPLVVERCIKKDLNQQELMKSK